MAPVLEKLINDLSLLLVMVDPSDGVGIEAACELCVQIAGAARQEHPRLSAAFDSLAPARLADNGGELLVLLADLVRAGQAYLHNPDTAIFPGAEKAAANSEIGPNFDEEFLVEFIEKHGATLDELEGAVLQYRFSEGAQTAAVGDFDSYVRGLVHTIKGDAGTIGLSGIERACHGLEDVFVSRPPSAIADAILIFKEWLSKNLAALSAKEQAAENSAAFLLRLQESLDPLPEDVLSGPAAAGEPVEGGEYGLLCDPALIGEFAAEAEDHLSSVESILLERDGKFTAEDIDTIFRAVHSIKGASSYFNLIEINESSHRLENLLDEVREGGRPMESKLIELVFTYIDLQKQLLTAAKKGIQADGRIRRDEATITFLERLKNYAAQSGLSTANAARPAEVRVEGEIGCGQGAAPGKPKDALGVKSFVKVDTNRLDRLVDSIGEMVIYSSILVRACQELLPSRQNVQKTCRQVEKFSRELQDIGMAMRLDPVRGLFQKMSRLVWDGSKKLKKEILFSMKGEDTELDRTVIERLADPLMHMVRNAIDHGIELPGERESAGKPRAGAVELSASHKGGNIIIEIKDDGRGLDGQKLMAKAVQKGIIGKDDKLSEKEALHLIFAPGFSTADKVTDISGRGVGMDVVRTNIESLRGRVTIDTEIGRGTCFTIELPLTLAIIDGIELAVGSERFIVPTLSVVELLRPKPEMLGTTLNRGETLSFRGTFLPIFRISELYDIEAKCKEAAEGALIVVESSGEQFALLFDGIVGSCQTVIKSLGSVFSRTKGLSGCAVMSNGEIGLILDVRSLAQLARAERGCVRAGPAVLEQAVS